MGLGDKIKEGYYEIKENPSYYVHYFVTFGLLIFTFILSLIFFFITSKYQDIENTRYLLSAIIQSLAAILAIVVTVTFVSIQLASQTYSSRVTRIFIHLNKFWNLITVFLLSIIMLSYGLAFLKIEHAYYFSLAAIGLTLVNFLVLTDYVRNIPKLLSLDFLLQESFKRINKKFLDTLAKSKSETGDTKLYIPEPENPLLLFYDIQLNAIIRKDLASLKSSNFYFKEEIKKKIETGVLNPTNESIFSVFALDILDKILELELDAQDIDAIRSTYDTLLDLGELACTSGFDEFLENIGRLISSSESINLEKGNKPNVFGIITLDSILNCLIKNKYPNDLVFTYIRAIFFICHDAGEKTYYYFTYEGIARLENIQEELTKEKKKYRYSIQEIKNYLDGLKKQAEKNT